MNEKKLKKIDEAIDALNGVFIVAPYTVPVKASQTEFILKSKLDGSFSPGCTGFSEIHYNPICTRAEFESRVRERKNKPSWDDVGSHMGYIAQDKDGRWWAYSEIASVGSEDYWATIGTYAEPHGLGEVIGDWKNTLEERPKQSKKEDPQFKIGDSCRVKYNDAIVDAVIVGEDSVNGVDVVVCRMDINESMTYAAFKAACLIPKYNEYDELVKRMNELLGAELGAFAPTLYLAEKIIHDGWRPVGDDK